MEIPPILVDDIDALKKSQKIVDNIKNTPNDCLSNNERIKLLENEAENNNVFALYELGLYYQNGNYVAPNDDIAISYFKKFTELKLVNDVNTFIWNAGGLFNGCHPGMPSYIRLDMLYAEELILSGAIGDVYSKLGYYYKNDFDKQAYVEHCFWIAMLHGFDCKTERDEASRRLQKKTNTNIKENISTLKKDHTCNEIRDSLMHDFGENNWSKLKKESRLSLITGIFCYKKMDALDSDSKNFIDFSAAVIPFMKVLEAELGERFYNQYMTYLKHYLPCANDYVTQNNIAPNDIKFRQMIIKQKRNQQIEYEEQLKLFTLGNFPYICGVSNFSKDTKPDNTMVTYCHQYLLNENSLKKNEVSAWLIDLVKYICSLKKTRNDAAHGGKIVEYNSAKNCIDDIIVIKKILIKLISACKH